MLNLLCLLAQQKIYELKFPPGAFTPKPLRGGAGVGRKKMTALCPPFLLCFSANVIKTMNKSRLVGKVCFRVQPRSQSTTRGSLWRRVLAPHGSLCFLPIAAQDYLPWGGTAHSRRGPATSIINQEDAPHICLWAIPQSWFLFPGDSSLCQLDVSRLVQPLVVV